jgi:hypothetical protein
VSESLGNLPTAEQLLILHAALDPAPAAAVAWQLPLHGARALSRRRERGVARSEP